MKQNLLPENYDFDQGAPLWIVHPNRKSIERQFTFKDFQQAFEFMTLSAQYAEEINHHPDWSNSWNQVRVTLTTHSSGGAYRARYAAGPEDERFSQKPLISGLVVLALMLFFIHAH